MNGVSAPAPRILLVEDNPGDADLIDELLDDGAGSGLVRAASLDQALARLREGGFDVVLLDLQLPDGFGLDCVNTVRAHHARVPVVVLTGIDDESLGLRCVAAGAQDYLSKQQLQRWHLRRAIDYAILRFREQSERQRADALQALLAAIVASSHDAIVSSTVDGVVTSWNRGAEKIFGYSADEAVGRPVHRVIAPRVDEVRGEHERRIFLARRGAHVGVAEEVERLHKDGHLLSLSVVTSVICDADGQTVALAAILRDITDSKRRDAELLRMTQQQAAREQRMTALVSRLRNLQEEERTRMSREVHDGLGQLLTGVKLDLRWLGRKLAAGAEPAVLAAKLVEAEALLDQTVTTVQRLALELRPSALDALGLAAAVRDEARRFEERTGVRTQVDIRAAGKPERAVGTTLFRILQELMTNVARHAQATELSIDLCEDDGHWVLVARDNGIGLPPDLANGSTSLGLLGMTERAEAVGGRFTIEPAPGRGTLGTVVVPVATAR